MTIFTSGGAGYGDPRLRQRERVLRDVEQGVISSATARDIYGNVGQLAAD